MFFNSIMKLEDFLFPWKLNYQSTFQNRYYKITTGEETNDKLTVHDSII